MLIKEIREQKLIMGYVRIYLTISSDNDNCIENRSYSWIYFLEAWKIVADRKK